MQTRLTEYELDGGAVGSSTSAIDIAGFTRASVGMRYIGLPWVTGGSATLVVKFQGSVTGVEWEDIATLQLPATAATQIADIAIASYPFARFVVTALDASVRLNVSLFVYDLQTPTTW